jgi:type VI secretion system FHA domain protein
MLLDEDEADTLVPPPGQGFTIELVEEEPPAPAPRAKAKSKPKTKAMAAAAKTSATAAKPAAAKAAPAPPPAASKDAAAARPSGTGASQALDDQLHGAGLDPKHLDEGDANHSLQNLGRVFREVIVGLNENLYLRSAHKTMLKQPNTTIQPRGNNPLKFSASVDEALQNLVFRKSDEYLPAVEAVRDAFGDIKWHQHALVKALTTAVPNYAARLDPDRLEEKLSRGRTSALMGAANKLKYWDLYKDLYLVVTQHPDGELSGQFLEELAQAYEHESARGRPAAKKKSASPTSLQAKTG